MRSLCFIRAFPNSAMHQVQQARKPDAYQLFLPLSAELTLPSLTYFSYIGGRIPHSPSNQLASNQQSTAWLVIPSICILKGNDSLFGQMITQTLPTSLGDYQLSSLATKFSNPFHAKEIKSLLSERRWVESSYC